MSDITNSTGFVSFDKDGFLSLDGVRLNIRELLDKIDSKPTNYIQVDMPEKYSILDWWFNPEDGVLCMAVETEIGLIWKETTFGVNSLLKSAITSGEITSTVLNNIMNDFYAKIQEIGVKLVSGELIKNNGDLTNGEIAFRKTKVVNYIYNGALDLPPLCQTGGKIWNRDKNGFNRIDSHIHRWRLVSGATWNTDSIYDNFNKFLQIKTYDKTSSSNLTTALGVVYGETAIEMLGDDFIFSMDIDVTKATQVWLSININDGHGGAITNQYVIAKQFNLTPGRKIEKSVITIPPISNIQNLTINRKEVIVSISMYLENTIEGTAGGIPIFNGVQNNTLTFYNIKLNRGTVILDNIKNDYKNMSFYKDLFPYANNTIKDNLAPLVKCDFRSGWTIPGWCTVSTYKTILNDGTPFDNRPAEDKDILTSMGYHGVQNLMADVVIKRIVWTAREGHALPYFWLPINPLKLFTTAAFIKLVSGQVHGFYAQGAELNKWKLCGSTMVVGLNAYTYPHPFNNNSSVSGGGELLIAMAGVVDGHVDLSNPTNWRLL